MHHVRPAALRVPLSVLAAALLLPGCDPAAVPSPDATLERDSAGVRIVDDRSPGDRAWGRRVSKVGELEIPDDALDASPWGVASDPATGRTYVPATGERIAVFDSSGVPAGTFGRSGDGPGEFRSPSALSVEEDGTVAVWDAGRAVISRWSSDGELLEEEPAPVSYWGPGFHRVGNGVATVTLERAPREERQHLVLAAAGDTAILHTVQRDLVMMELPCVSQPTSRIFAPDVVWAGSGDAVHVLHGPEYRIDSYRDGAQVASARRSPGPVRMAESTAVDRVRAQFGGLLRMCEVTAEEVVAAIGYEEVVAPVQWIAVDPLGRLWVTRSEDGLGPARVDVLDPDGRYEGTLDAPGMVVAFPSPSRFVALSPEEGTGRIVLALYELDAPAPDGGPADEGGAS